MQPSFVFPGSTLPILAAAICAFLAPATVRCQAKPSAAIPPTGTTAAPAAATPYVPPQAAPGRAGTVTWNGSELTVMGNGDLLSNLVRAVSRDTGMKVTGSVPAVPVFGTYGPAPAQRVLSQLFDGLSLNMLLINGTPAVPREMILTTRTGGPTPPQPTQAYEDDNPNPRGLPQGFPGAGSFTPPVGQPAALPATSNGATPSSAVPVTATPAASPDNGSANPAQPTAPLTPEQVFQQLRDRMQQGNAPR